MARFEIKSKDGNSVRYSGKPRYNGSYLRPSYIEFSEVSSPTPIDWEVGDYVDYIRTGMRYRLYSIPQPSKNAKMGSCGNAFTYSNVQFYAATKELEIALFKDLVSSDNNIHFSTSPDVNTYEDIYGIVRRIQACMDYFYPNRWQIKVADFDETNDAEIIEKVSTAKDFSLSNGTCLDALSKIYELWQDIGWIHTYENSKETITIGYTSKRIESNTTSPFIYGKGNGLTAIRRNQINKDEFATRLYVYGSERNLPARYYNGKDILNAESVDIRNLMLPLDKWGQTDGKPDARKAYLENAEAVAKYGVIPKTHYFDSEEAGADIYPSIKGMTIGDVRNALSALGETLYYPSRDIYKDSSARVDQLLGGSSMIDDGVISKDGKKFDFNVSFDIQQSTTMGYILPGYTGKATVLSDYVLWGGNLEQGGRGTITVNPNVVCKISVEQPYAGVTARVVVTNSEHPSYRMIYGEGVFEGVKRDGTNNWEIDLGAVSADYINKEYESFPVYVLVSIVVSVEDTTTVEDGVGITFRSGSIDVSYKKYLAKSFNLSLRQIGFNINERADAGKGKSISIKTGPCAGRSFEITACKYYPTGDSWVLTCKRQQDNTLGIYFPNTDSQIEMGNEFVLTDIAMPEIYIYAGMQRLLSEGNKLLAQASKIQNTYEPSIDAKVMIESGRTLREGMFMEITDGDVVDGTTDYILIDTLSIYEDESAIPTYKVTLKERRKVTYKGTPSATSSTDIQPVEEDHTPQANVDLSAYAKQEDLSSLEKRVASEEETTQKYQSWWDKVMSHLTVDAEGNVTIDTNLIVSGDTASGGAGQDNPVGIQGIKLNGQTYTDYDGDGVIDLGELGGGDLDIGTLETYLSDNKYIKADNLDTYGVATKSWVNNQDFAKTSALSGYLPKSGGTLSGNLTMSGNSHIVTHEVYPATTDTYYLGSESRRWTNVVTKNINGYTPIHSGNIANQLVKGLVTPRSIWGQSFDGTGNVSGDLNLGYAKLTFGTDGSIYHIGWNSSTNMFSYKSYYGHYFSTDGVERLRINQSGDVQVFKNLIVSGDVASGGAGQETTGYLPLSGGTIDGTSVDPLIINSTASSVGIRLQINNANKTYVGYGSTVGAYLYNYDTGAYIGVDTGGSPFYHTGSTKNTLIHAGNIGSYAVTASGSTGMNATAFLKWGTALGSTDLSDWDSIVSSLGLRIITSTTAVSSSHAPTQYATGLHVKGRYGFQIAAAGGSADLFYMRRTNSSDTWRTLIHSGNISQYTGGSDIRYKRKVRDVSIDIEDLVNAPFFEFYWMREDMDKDIHAGTSAQYWEVKYPSLVSGVDFRSLNYGALAIGGLISIAKKVKELEAKIK